VDLPSGFSSVPRCGVQLEHLGGGNFRVVSAPFTHSSFLLPPSRETTPLTLLTLGFGLGLGLMGAAALATRRRPGWRAALALSIALLPAGVGLALGWDTLSEAWASLHSPVFCLPRDEMASVGLVAARRRLGAGLAAAVALLLVALVVGFAGLRRGARRGPLLLPLAGLLAVGLGAVATLGRFRRVEAAQTAPLAPLFSADAPRLARLAHATQPSLAALPDLPLVLLGADGSARYDDSRGQQPPGPLPVLVGRSDAATSLLPLEHLGDEPPSIMLVAVDERASFGALDAVLASLKEKKIESFRFAFARSAAAPQHAADLGLIGITTTPLPPISRGRRWEPKPTLHPHLFLDASGVRIRVPVLVPPGCDLSVGLSFDPLDRTPTIARQAGAVDMEALRACVRKLKAASPEYKEETEAWLLPDASTPWSEVAAAIDALRDGDDLFPEISLGFESRDFQDSLAGYARIGAFPGSSGRPRPLSSGEQSPPGPKALVSGESQVVSGKILDTERTMALFKAKTRACYQQALLSNVEMQGKLVFSLDLDASGRVLKVTMTPSGSLSPSMGSCARNAANGLVFRVDSPTAILQGSLSLSTKK
jgi:hypothetical protein